MEYSPSFSPSSSSSPPNSNPNSNLDQQPRLTVTQLEQLKVEQKVAEIYRLLDGVSAHHRSLMLAILELNRTFYFFILPSNCLLFCQAN